MSWLHNKHPIVISAELAKHIGLNEAIVLQQLNYWIEGTSSGVEFDGRRWVYNTQDQWQEQFPFWSVDTVKRAFASLKKQGVILVEQLAKAKHDRTNYYAIDHAKLEQMEAETRVVVDQGKLPSSSSAKSPNRRGQAAPIDKGELPPSNGAGCTNVHTETTTETTAETFAADAAASAGGAKEGELVPAVVPEPMRIEAHGKVYEIPGHLRYPGPDAKSHRTWINYALCYQRRYQSWPLWNATIAGQVTKFIARVGAEVAPKVAAFYVGVNDKRAVALHHPVGHLLANAEAFHTQFQTGRTMTATRAQQIDQTQSNFDAVQEAMQILDSRREVEDAHP